MTQREFFLALRVLAIAFEKNLSEELQDLWWSEMKSYSLHQIQSAVRKMLDSPFQKAFPRIGEFKAVIPRSKELKTSGPTIEKIPSCPRCIHGQCIIEYWHGRKRITAVGRCCCPSGDHWPGFPFVSKNLIAVKYRLQKEIIGI
jgi:hypothetical protein